MIDSSKLRIHYQEYCVDPIVRLCATSSISPISITLFGCVLGLLIAPLLFFDYKIFALTALVISGYLDTLDGAFARHIVCATPLGAVLDIISDRLVEFSIILGLFLQEPQERGLFCLLMAGSVLICVTSFLVVGIFEKNATEKSFYYSPGIMERAEAFLFFFAMILWPQLFDLFAASFIVLVFLTAFIRVMQFKNKV